MTENENANQRRKVFFLVRVHIFVTSFIATSGSKEAITIAPQDRTRYPKNIYGAFVQVESGGDLLCFGNTNFGNCYFHPAFCFSTHQYNFLTDQITPLLPHQFLLFPPTFFLYD
ncbi:unnamed protein product [Albugo candida]|uniref:Uncharacterized protein n=1 Tax=Albugo candida TaxID=65357 RepID=A0A024FWY6_9STRA|nr:unnamed protein product [Albugo candida]|eukprot:CCI11630.1 unnamed protein product [Albugo candida]